MFQQLFAATSEFSKLTGALSTPGAAALFGLPAAGRAQVYAALSRAMDRPLCIVTPGEVEATRFAADLNTLGIPAAVFPSRDYVLRPIEDTSREYEYRRLSVLGDLVGGRLRAVCVPCEGLTQYTIPRQEFCRNTRTLRPGDSIPREELTAALTSAGYTRRDRVDGPGQFSVRGDIVDIFAPDMKAPARIEFWGDEIDSLHSFDLATQRRDNPLEKLYLSPAREVLFGDPAGAAALLRAYLGRQRGRKKTAMAACMEADLAMLDGGALPIAVDKYITVRYPNRPPSWTTSMIRCMSWRNRPPCGRRSAPPSSAGTRSSRACWRTVSSAPGWIPCTPRRAGCWPRRPGIPPSAPRTLPAACRT